MIGNLRLGLALAAAAGLFFLLLPFQLLANRTGWLDENYMRSLAHRFHLFAIGIRVTRRGRLSDRRPLLVVSNHVSWADIPVLAAGQPLTFIAKAEVARWPVIGFLARLQRCIFVDRTRRRDSSRQADEIGGRLAANQAVVLFAEGTTGDGNFLLPFKSSLFGAAAKAIANGGGETVWVQPAALAYTHLHGMPMGRRHRVRVSWLGDEDLLPDLAERLREGGLDVVLAFGEPVAVTAATDRKALARDMQAAVDAMVQAALSGRDGIARA